MTVYLRVNPSVQEAVTLRAEGMASEMFGGIGVRIDWHSGQPATSSPHGEIAIELATATPPSFEPGAFAYALPYEGVHIQIFYDRIKRTPAPGELLAHVMAHEITHILQGISHHSDSGVMKARWSAEDFSRMRYKALPFAEEDVVLIHRGLMARAAAAEQSPILTIQVSNFAEVDRVTLMQGEKTATGIFEKAGVETRWIEPSGGGSFPLSHIQLKILPSVMSLRSGLPDHFPDSAMGLAPGSGRDRQSVYVFYNRVEAVATKHAADTHADAAQILGHVIAHEIGHLMLNDQTHSAAGIMRGVWNFWDLQNVSYGYLLFTPRQAKAIRDEAGRRFRLQEPLPKSGETTHRGVEDQSS